MDSSAKRAPILATTPLAQLREDHPRAWDIVVQRFPAWRESGAATVGGLLNPAEDPDPLLYQLNRAADRLDRLLPRLPLAKRIQLTGNGSGNSDPQQLALLLDSLPAPQRSTLDTRPILNRGQDPFQTIQARVAQLPEGGILELLVPFEPLPLYHVMKLAGFAHLTAREGALWRVCFYRHGNPLLSPEQLARVRCQPHAPSHPCPLSLDVRQLPAPEPLVRILESCATLAPGGTLRVRHHRIPQLLYPRLAERGLAVETREEENGEVLLIITRPP